MEILVVDLETTGFDSKTDLIVEIGIVLVNTDTKEIKMVFDKPIKETGFDYETHKNSWIFENTTLSVEDVMSAKPIEDYFDEIQGLFDKYKMTAFNKTQIKNINIKFDTGVWNPQTHNILLSYDPLATAGFIVKIVSVNDEPPITSFKEADEILKKFKIK